MLLTLAFIALGIAGVGLISALIFGLVELITYIRRRIDFTEVWNQAHTENALLTKLNELLYPQPELNYRHNIHCPSCGRFAKRVLGMDTVVECAVHQVQFREWDVDVDWAVRPLTEGVTFITSPVLVSTQAPDELPDLITLDLELEEIYRQDRNYTGSIPIILPAIDSVDEARDELQLGRL